MVKNAKPGRRRLIKAMSVCGIPAATWVWTKPIVNSIVLPAHAVTSETSTPRIPFQLEGVWLARYVTRSALFTLTINNDGSVLFFQEILTFAGIPINRVERLELESVSQTLREIRWRSDLTEIVVFYNESFESLEGTDQPAGRVASEFVATPI